MVIELLVILAALGAGLSCGYLIGSRTKYCRCDQENIGLDKSLPMLNEDGNYVIRKEHIVKSCVDYEHNKWLIEGRLYD